MGIFRHGDDEMTSMAWAKEIMALSCYLTRFNLHYTGTCIFNKLPLPLKWLLVGPAMLTDPDLG